MRYNVDVKTKKGYTFVGQVDRVDLGRSFLVVEIDEERAETFAVGEIERLSVDLTAEENDDLPI